MNKIKKKKIINSFFPSIFSLFFPSVLFHDFSPQSLSHLKAQLSIIKYKCIYKSTEVTKFSIFILNILTDKPKQTV